MNSDLLVVLLRDFASALEENQELTKTIDGLAEENVRANNQFQGLAKQVTNLQKQLAERVDWVPKAQFDDLKYVKFQSDEKAKSLEKQVKNLENRLKEQQQAAKYMRSTIERLKGQQE